MSALPVVRLGKGQYNVWLPRELIREWKDTVCAAGATQAAAVAEAMGMWLARQAVKRVAKKQAS